MRPGRPTPLTLTRRALGTRLAGFAAAIGFGQSAVTSVAAQPASALDPELRDAALRGLALASHRGDPVAAAAAEAALARLAETDPEAALLGRIYQLLDVRPAAYWPDNSPAAGTTELAILLTPDWLPGQRPAIDLLQEENERLATLMIGSLTSR